MNLGRKVSFGAYSLLVGLVALEMCLRRPDAGKVLFSSFAALVAGVVTAVVVGNVGEWISKRGQP